MCDYPGVAQPSQWEVLVGNLDGVGVQARSWFWRLEERSEGEFNVSESSGVIKSLLLLQSILLRQVEFAWPH